MGGGNLSEICDSILLEYLKIFDNHSLKLFKNVIKNKPAFTLAETLITIGMIGVIAVFSIDSSMIDIDFDIDGPKKGNSTIGKDIFNIKINDNRVGTLNSSDHANAAKACRQKYSIVHCTDWVLHYNNADYLNCEVNDSNPTCN